MQQNNKNLIIADELDVISRKINKLDKDNVSASIAEIHNYHNEIEQIAREYELTTLLAVVDWVDLSTELTDENSKQIETLLTNDSFSKWIEVIVSLLKDYNDNLRPEVHQSLTSPEWIVKPSTILLKDIAFWIAVIKLEHENDTQVTEESIQAQISEKNSAEHSDLKKNESETPIEDSISLSGVHSTTNVIENQLKKADIASDEAMLQQNIFEEVNQEILEKDYTNLDTSDEILNDGDNTEDKSIPLMETEKSSIDDEQFEITNANPSDVDDKFDSVIESNSFNDTTLINELSNIHKTLESTHVSSNDVFLSKDSFTKQLDQLILITEETELKSIVPIVDWCQRNILLFQDNTTSNIEKFITSNSIWSWIENLVNCLTGENNSECLDSLTSSLTNKEWLEPLEKENLEELLIGINNAIYSKKVAIDTNSETQFESFETSTDITESPIDNLDNNLPELLDNPITVDNSFEDSDNSKKSDDVTNEEIELSGLQLTWDDDTHPELLMVYLEETPIQIEELLPLLDKISTQKADNEEKETAARLAHTIKGGSSVVGITALADYSSHLETLLEHSVTSQLNDNILNKLTEIGVCIDSTFKAVQLQGEEPVEFLPTFKLLEEYPYDLDVALTDVKEHQNSTEIVSDDPIDIIENKDNLVEESLVENSILEDVETNDEHNKDNTVEVAEINDETDTENSSELTETNHEINEEESLEITETKSEVIEDDIVKENIIEELAELEDETVIESAEDSSDNMVIAAASLAAAALAGKEVINQDKEDESDNSPETLETDKEIVSEKSGFKMTWDDDTHPELLMVYLEETPTQITELVPLLNKISENKADAEDKHTASRMAHTIKGGSAIVGLTTLSEISYRLETLLDHSVKHQLPDEILETLSKTGTCIEDLFEAIQMQEEEPYEYLSIFQQLDTYVDSIDDLDDEVLELSSVALPEFIVNQNKGVETKITNDSEENVAETVEEEQEITSETSEEELTAIEEETSEIEIGDIKAEVEEKETGNAAIAAAASLAAATLIGNEIVDKDEISSSDSNIETSEVSEDVIEKEVSEKSGFNMTWDDDTHPELLMVYLEETPTQITELVPLLHKISENKADAEEKHTASRMAHTIKGGSAIVGLTTLSEISYRLETLLDHSVKHQLPDEILETLPKTATCIEALFDAVQMQEEEPKEYFGIFKQLDTYVNSIDDLDDEILELSSVSLPDFIVNQNKDDETKLVDEVEANIDESDNEEVIAETTKTELEDVTEVPELEIETEDTNELKESIDVDPVKLDKLKTKEDVNNIIVEIDDIVLNLISHASLSNKPAEYAEKCTVELERFELMTDLSGYPELSLLSQWSQSNLEAHAKRKTKKFKAFIDSNEIWSWVEHVGDCLRESDDMSHMSSLSVELMREDWRKAIKMEDLQTVLLALRHLEDTGTAEVVESETADKNVDEVISWDKDVHPELLAVYFQETPDQIDHVAGLLHKISRGESSTKENKEAARIAHTIKGSSGVVGLNSLLDLTHHLEDILDYSVNNEITPDTADLLSEASDCMESLFETIQNKQAPPDELTSVLERLSSYSGKLSPEDKGLPEDSFTEEESETLIKTSETVIASTDNDVKAFTDKSAISNVDTNEAYIRVPIKVIDKLLNLAGELVTTSNQVSDNLAKTQETNKTIRNHDERVLGMLEDLNKTIEQQEKDQQNLFSSMENSDFDSLEMDTYNELNSVASLLSESILDSQEIDNTLSNQLDELTERLHSLDKLNKTFSDVILSSRMVTIDTIVPRLERIVRQTCRKTNKKARLKVTGNNLNIDTDILNNLVDPLLHMLRNSIDHGIELPAERVKNKKDEAGLIELSFSRDGNNILMTLSDDGAGINPEKIYEKAIEKEIITPDQEFSDSDAIKLILQAGFSTQENVTDISGRGVGMDVVNTSIQDLNGTMGIESNLGEGTSFNLTIPLTLITNTTLLVKVEDNILAIPTDTIEQIMYQQAETLIQRDGNYYVTYADEEIKTTSLGQFLNWPHQMIDQDKSYNVLIIKTDDETHAIHVDGIESSREVVVKRLSPWISPAKGVIGACHLNDGGVAPVINLITVVKEASALAKLNKNAPVQIIRPDIKKQILVVDDSLSNRKALSLIIDKTDFDVVTAVDGLDALRVMNEQAIDLVFTDLEMPRMNGLELTQSIRAWNDKSSLPIVMITSRTTNKHRELAKKAGVDDYLTKPVETETLLQAIDTWLDAKVPAEA